MRNIVLIGFQGVGKTFHGERLAKELGKDFIDTDREIEREYNFVYTIREIHERLGEDKFRALERQMIIRRSGVTNTVIATGGGVVEVKGVGLLLRGLGRVVYLYGDLACLQKRWKRPGSFLKGKNIEEFFQRRAKLYEQVCTDKVEGTWDQILLVGSSQ